MTFFGGVGRFICNIAIVITITGFIGLEFGSRSSCATSILDYRDGDFEAVLEPPEPHFILM